MKNGNRLLKSSIFNRFFPKLTHIMLGPIRWNVQNIGLIRKNVTYVSMAKKIPIIKHREFLHISMCYISAIYEHIASKFTPVMQGNKWRILKNQMTLKCQRSMSNISRTRKITFLAITLEPEVVETSSWTHHVPWGNTDRDCCLRYNERSTVFASHDQPQGQT